MFLDGMKLAGPEFTKAKVIDANDLPFELLDIDRAGNTGSERSGNGSSNLLGIAGGEGVKGNVSVNRHEKLDARRRRAGSDHLVLNQGIG